MRRRFPEPQHTSTVIYAAEKVAKLGCVSKILCIVLCFVCIAASIIAVGYFRAPFTALPIPFPSMEIELFGSLRANRRLTQGSKITGLPEPEVLLLDEQNNLYTGLADGRIIKVGPSAEGVIGTGNVTNITTGINHKISPTYENAQNGRPHGLRLQDDKMLYVADGVYGIYSFNLLTNETTLMVSIDDMKPPMRHPRDLCFSKDRSLLYFSDASSRNTLTSSVHSFLDGHTDSRVMRYNTKTRRLHVVASKLSFVSGVQLSEDENVLYICETFRFRLKLLDTTTWKTLKVVPLPMMPNMIRPTGKGTYWVAGSTIRNSRHGFMEKYPFLRQTVAGLFNPSTITRFLTNSYSILVEMRKDGKIIQSLHDPDGELIPGLATAITLNDGKVALGSNTMNFFSILDEKHIVVGGAY